MMLDMPFGGEAHRAILEYSRASRPLRVSVGAYGVLPWLALRPWPHLTTSIPREVPRYADAASDATYCTRTESKSRFDRRRVVRHGMSFLILVSCPSREAHAESACLAAHAIVWRCMVAVHARRFIRAELECFVVP